MAGARSFQKNRLFPELLTVGSEGAGSAEGNQILLGIGTQLRSGLLVVDF
jgi:hypothetical protein